MREPRRLVVIVPASELARPGVTLSAAYWRSPEEGGHRDGESASAWRKRLRREHSVRVVQERVARLGGMNGHAQTCDFCYGSGLVYDGDRFLPCTDPG